MDRFLMCAAPDMPPPRQQHAPSASPHADSQAITWSVLLAQWVDLARSALALADDAPGQAMKASVADIIMLQAVWHALQSLDALPPAEQALGCLRASWLIDRHAASLQARWQDAGLPEALAELITDARSALSAAQRHLCDAPAPPPTPPADTQPA